MLYLLISLDTYIIGIPRSTALINLFWRGRACLSPRPGCTDRIHCKMRPNTLAHPRSVRDNAWSGLADRSFKRADGQHKEAGGTGLGLEIVLGSIVFIYQCFHGDPIKQGSTKYTWVVVDKFVFQIFLLIVDTQGTCMSPACFFLCLSLSPDLVDHAVDACVNVIWHFCSLCCLKAAPLSRQALWTWHPSISPYIYIYIWSFTLEPHVLFFKMFIFKKILM